MGGGPAAGAGVVQARGVVQQQARVVVQARGVVQQQARVVVQARGVVQQQARVVVQARGVVQQQARVVVQAWGVVQQQPHPSDGQKELTTSPVNNVYLPKIMVTDTSGLVSLSELVYHMGYSFSMPIFYLTYTSKLILHLSF